MTDEGGHVQRARQCPFNFLALSLLIGVKDVRFLGREPRQHFAQLWLDWAMAKHEYPTRIDCVLFKQIIERQLRHTPADYPCLAWGLSKHQWRSVQVLVD